MLSYFPYMCLIIIQGFTYSLCVCPRVVTVTMVNKVIVSIIYFRVTFLEGNRTYLIEYSGQIEYMKYELPEATRKYCNITYMLVSSRQFYTSVRHYEGITHYVASKLNLNLFMTDWRQWKRLIVLQNVYCSILFCLPSACKHPSYPKSDINKPDNIGSARDACHVLVQVCQLGKRLT